MGTGKLRPAMVTTLSPNSRWAPRMKATKTTQSSVTGMRNFQPKRMNWSYRKRGSEPRSQTKTNMKIQSLARTTARPTSRR